MTSNIAEEKKEKAFTHREYCAYRVRGEEMSGSIDSVRVARYR
jgi:hypothetical protein